MSEDVLILDTQSEVFVWVGQCADTQAKQSAFEVGQVFFEFLMGNLSAFYSDSKVIFFWQKYIDMAISLESLPPKVPLYKVTEGNEPCFFTMYFTWDPTKANVCP